MNDKITISINKNNLNNIFRNQNEQIFSLSKDGGETWQMMLTNKPNLHLEESNKYTELINLLKKKRQIEREWQSKDNNTYSNEEFINVVYELKDIDRKINNIVDLL